MPNARGGKSYKTHKKTNSSKGGDYDLNDGMHFGAVVMGRKGGTQVEVTTTRGEKTNAIIPGRMYNKVWLNPNDIVIVYRNGNSCEIVSKVESKQLKRELENILSAYIKSSYGISTISSDVVFEDDSEMEEDDENIIKSIKTGHDKKLNFMRGSERVFVNTNREIKQSTSNSNSEETKSTESSSDESDKNDDSINIDDI